MSAIPSQLPAFLQAQQQPQLSQEELMMLLQQMQAQGGDGQVPEEAGFELFQPNLAQMGIGAAFGGAFPTSVAGETAAGLAKGVVGKVLPKAAQAAAGRLGGAALGAAVGALNPALAIGISLVAAIGPRLLRGLSKRNLLPPEVEDAIYKVAIAPLPPFANSAARIAWHASKEGKEFIKASAVARATIKAKDPVLYQRVLNTRRAAARAALVPPTQDVAPTAPVQPGQPTPLTPFASAMGSLPEVGLVEQAGIPQQAGIPAAASVPFTGAQAEQMAGIPAAAQAAAVPAAASVPFMITNKMRQQLGNLGYRKDAIARLTPQEANDIIATKRRYSATAASVGDKEDAIRMRMLGLNTEAENLADQLTQGSFE